MRHEPSSGYEDPSKNYRVTWQTFKETPRTNEHGYWMVPEIETLYHEKIFTGRDTAWDFYQDRLKSPHSFAATWEHIDAMGESHECCGHNCCEVCGNGEPDVCGYHDKLSGGVTPDNLPVDQDVLDRMNAVDRKRKS